VPSVTGGIYIPVRGWGDKPAERGIEIKPMLVSDVLERTEWLELLRDLVAAAKIKLRVGGNPPERCVAQRTLRTSDELPGGVPFKIAGGHRPPAQCYRVSS
jgi:hypothetical protein